jgi:succinate---hydroxymethylglutarate CoA-transferase
MEPHDLQLAGLANIASNFLIAGQEASRYGTAHPSIVPYQVFKCKDGFLMIGAGNDKQVTLLMTSPIDENRDIVYDTVQTLCKGNPPSTCPC